MEAQKPPVPHGNIFWLGSDPRTSCMFKGKRPEVGTKTMQLLEETQEKNIQDIGLDIFI